MSQSHSNGWKSYLCYVKTYNTSHLTSLCFPFVLGLRYLVYDEAEPRHSWYVADLYGELELFVPLGLPFPRHHRHHSLLGLTQRLTTVVDTSLTHHLQTPIYYWLVLIPDSFNFNLPATSIIYLCHVTIKKYLMPCPRGNHKEIRDKLQHICYSCLSYIIGRLYQNPVGSSLVKEY